MSKRTKMKLNNLRLYLVKYVFNGRYIVRNTLAVTVLVTVIAAVYGVVSVIGMQDGSEKEKTGGVVAVAAENDLENGDTQTMVLNMAETPMMNTGSINILMAGLDTDTKTDVRPNETQMVTGKNGGIFVVIEEDGVYVRATPSADAELVGSLYEGDTGDVLGREGEWFHISMLDIEGYVKQDYILTGDEADAYIEAHAAKEEQEEEKDKEEQDSKNKDSEDKENETQGDESPSDRTTEQQAAETPSTEQNQVVSEPVTTEEPTTEDNTEEPEEPSGSTTVGVTYRSAVSLSEADINLMASVMTLECGGESYEGQLAVANVILNRYLSGAYGSTMSDVCYAPYQFSVVSLPQFESYVQNGAQASCLQAAREALSGVNNIGGFVSFRPSKNVSNPDSLGSYTIIGNHIFF